jgi:hypothetical protein
MPVLFGWPFGPWQAILPKSERDFRVPEGVPYWNDRGRSGVYVA